MKPKTYILIALPALCLWLYSFTGYSQLYNCGTNIKIGAGTTLAVNGKFSNKTAEGIDATINNAGKIYVTGDWINNTAGNVFINIGSNGTVYLNGDSIQNIAGSSPTFFENITFTGTGEKILGILGIAIKGLMALDAVLKLNHHRLIIDNSSPGALTYTARIISEDLPAAGYGELQWNTGAATGSYNIPFGNSSGDIFPLCFTITEGSPGNGQIIFATYPADSAGMPLPEGTAAPTDPDKTADRYWIIDLQNYAALPKADIQFTYLQSEISSASNTIDEARLKAAYYDQSSGFWLLASGVADTTTNKVTTNELYNELQNKVWTLKQAAADTGTTCQTARLLPPATYACTGTELQITGTEYWMKFTADTSKLMIVISNTSRVPMANITKLQLFSGNCDNLTLISQKEKVNNEFLNLSIDSLVVDSSYLIKVSQPQSVTGFFNIFLRPLIPERPKYFKGALYFKVKEAFTANLCYDVDSSYSYNHIALDSLPFIVNFNITGILKPFNSQASSLQRTYKLLCNDATNLDTLISRFLSLAFIDYCVKLPVYYPSDDNLLPLTDTRLSDQWYFNQIYATGAWNAPVGSNTVRVAIIDDAFLISHEDFLGVVSQGYYDYANDDTDPTPPIGAGGMAYNFSHGTHCAGLLAAASDNGKGIASLNRGNIQIIPYKVKLDLIDPDNPSEFMMGLEDIVGNICDMVPPPQVISMSFGSLAYNPLWGDIISSHTDDILFVAAAGNDNLGACHYPAAFAESKPNIISVGATTYNDERAFFSNFGSVEDQISVVAPGYNILSTSSASNNSYEYKSGTSMSTPIVAGLSALLLTHNSNLTPAAIKQCLIDNGDALPLGTNFDESVKRINALKSLSCILNSNDPPVAFFNYQPACLSVQFTDHSIAPSGNDITSWSWSFQNASIPSSTDQNPTVVFNSYGTSQVSLTVTNSSGSHTYTQDITIEQPVSIVAHSSKTVCKNKPSYIYVQLQGEAPYTLTYQLNLLTPVTFTTYENPCPINITHQITDDQTIFHLTSFSNLACTSAVDLSFTFNLFDCTICSKEDYNWVFGNHAGITFQNGPVQNLTSPTSINQTNCTASISDNFGNLSFYTDGNTIWRASDGFEITSSLNADLSISQPVLAFQNPVYSNEYLIFTINAGNYYLSVLNIQTWDLSSSNQLLNSILPGTIRYQQSAFPIVNSFGNTIGFWVVVHSDNLEKYYTIRVENSNWSSWSVTTSNSNYNDASGSIGSIKFSHDGTKIVSSIGGDADEPAHIEICDFNLTNSDITNCKTFKLPYDYYFCSFYGYGLEFSPDNSKLYISDPNKVTLYQLDLISEDINIIAVAESNICLTTKAGGALLLAPDGRIYCPNQDNKKYLSVINDPDKPFPYCGFVLNGHSLAEDETDINVWSGLPNIAINCIPLGAAVTAFENITCAGQSLCNGSATVTASGGMPPYLYLWSDLSGQTTAAATNLCPGQYYVTVTDDNNDQAVANVTIIEPAMFSVSATVQHPCGGGSGAIHTIVNGGTPPYTYEWNTSETTDEIYPSPGTYYVTVTDANNCTATNGWTVETLYGPEDMNIDFSPQSCLYLDNSVSFTVSALQQPITTTYNWNFGDGHTAQGSAVSNTYDGNYGYYCVTLDAANQCGHSSFNKTFFVYPDDCACTTYNYPDQSNLGSGISGVTLTVEGDLFVTQNCTIQSSTLQFGPKGRLIVKKGKILTINQSLLTTLPTCNNYLWQGIEVWGYYNAPSDELNQGKIIIDNQTVIENAHIAVLLGARNIDYICDDSQPVFYNTASGGIINARTNSTFNSNGINIKFTPKHPSSLIAFTSEIKNCYFVGADLSAKDPLYVWSDIFTCYPNTTNPFTQASSGGITYMGIYVEELKNVGGLNGFYNNTFSNMQYGIESANARFNIKNCSFTDLGTGIFIHNYTSAINVYHSITD
ncbi:MAG: S8 family serine peptidase, partial [Bacteroidia bacterium]|nr:S8 family serine peptidase [Bacteroidia bacterium]